MPNTYWIVRQKVGNGVRRSQLLQFLKLHGESRDVLFHVRKWNVKRLEYNNRLLKNLNTTTQMSSHYLP